MRITRAPGTSSGLALTQLNSCYVCLYEIKYPKMEEEKRVMFAEDHCILASQFIITNETLQEVRKLLQHKKEKQKRLSLHEAIKNNDEVEKTYKSRIVNSHTMPTEASSLDKGMSTSILQINKMQLKDRSANQQVLTPFKNEECLLLKNFNNKRDETRGRTTTMGNNY